MNNVALTIFYKYCLSSYFFVIQQHKLSIFWGHVNCFYMMIMECYFGSYRLPPESEVKKSAVVIFSIPELGIKFKAPFNGVNDDHSDFASFLALLEFIDSNQKYFTNNTYQIFGNNLNIINQINDREIAPLEFSGFIDKAKNYRDKYHFSLDWISANSNPIFHHLFD